MYYVMLERFEKVSLNPNIELISKGMSKKNWTEMREGVNKIMTASALVGSGYVYYACVYIM